MTVAQRGAHPMNSTNHEQRVNGMGVFHDVSPGLKFDRWANNPASERGCQLDAPVKEGRTKGAKGNYNRVRILHLPIFLFG